MPTTAAVPTYNRREARSEASGDLRLRKATSGSWNEEAYPNALITTPIRRFLEAATHRVPQLVARNEAGARSLRPQRMNPNSPSHPDPKRIICAVIVSYRTGPSICECVDSVRDQVDRVLVVDNGSDVGTVNALVELEAAGGISVIYNSTNRGIAGALNQGARLAADAGYRYVLFMDDDSRATPGMVEMLLRAHQSLSGRTGIVAAMPVDRNVAMPLVGRITRSLDGNIGEVNSCLSAGSLVDLLAFKETGPLNESLFLYYVDDDFCMRLRRAGFKIYVVCEAVLLHAEGHKHRKRFLWRHILYDGYSPQARYYIARNTIFILKHYYRDYVHCYGVSKRLLRDLVKVVLLDQKRFQSVSFIVKGLFDGVRGKYGKLPLS